MRQLKYHEKKLLKKVDLLNWKSDDDHREVKVMRRYHLQNRDDYSKYNKLCGQIRQLAYKISLLSAEDPMRTEKEGQLLGKLYDSGLLSVGTKLSEVESKVTVSAMCRRRLAIICVKLKLCETVSTAVKYIEQGHIRVGPDRITDPAYLVTRNMEDFVTWVDTSKVKRAVLNYNDKLESDFPCLCNTLPADDHSDYDLL